MAIAIGGISLFVVGCIDPVTPVFDYTDGQIYVEGFASTARGASYVIINRSSTEYGLYRRLFEEGAQVSFKNIDTNEVIDLVQQDQIYAAPLDFAASVGDTWELNIVLADGKQIKSDPETVINPVQISDISATYDPELKYIDAYSRALPGHTISVSFNDPAEESNNYYWRFKSYESLLVCAHCDYGKLRDGVCVGNEPGFSYPCASDCWRVRYNENVNIFADNFTNGTSVKNLPIAEVLLYSHENILVRIEQFSLTPKAYKYFKTLKDLVDNNGGINAPPPAALIGNMFNVTDDEEFILGRFNAAATATYSIFINRSNIPEKAIETVPAFRTESGLGAVIVTEPCIDGKYRTTIRPDGWID